MGAREAHRAGAWGAFAWFGIVYALMLLLFPTVPLIIASGWLFGIFGASGNSFGAVLAALIMAAIGFLASRVVATCVARISTRSRRDATI